MLGPEQIKVVFEREFAVDYGVILQGGASEPYYRPAAAGEPACICYTHDYPASALHELSHWCLASEAQLAMPDWGLWYIPDGRSVAQQQRFQAAEARIQALEWILSVAAGRPFRESSDNLGGEYLDETEFKDAIYRRVQQCCEQGLPPRATRLFAALAQARGIELKLQAGLFQRAALDAMLGLELVRA